MSKSTIIIDGQGAAVTFNSSPIADINTISFSVMGERDEINLTTIDATAYKAGLLGDLVNVEDIVINKKFAPALDLAISQSNAQLVVTYKVGKSTSKTATFWAQYKGMSNGTIERAPSDGINVDLTFAVTNLNGSLAETGPVIA